jgi:hypothetical protein
VILERVLGREGRGDAALRAAKGSSS